jgi:hypothetical protein
MLRRIAVTASGSAVLFLAACGGAGGSSSGSALTLAQFITKADMVCTSADSSGAALPTPNVSSSLFSPNASDLPAIATYIGAVVQIGQSLESGLQGLGTPPSSQSSWSQALADVHTVITDLQAAQAAAQSANTAAYATAFSKTNADNTAVNAAFNSFGATGCANGSSSTATPSATPT